MPFRRFLPRFLLPGWIISALCLAYALYADSLPAAFFGMPFFLLMLILGHELGHLLGCRINGNTVTGLCVPAFSYRNHRFSLSDNPLQKSYCAFLTTGCDAAVYLGGPLASIAIAVFWVIFFLIRPGSGARGLCALAAVLHTLLNCMPSAGSDFVRAIHETKRRRPPA